MTKQKQIEEMAEDLENTILGLGIHLCEKSAEKLYDLGYRKIFTSDLANDTQKAFKEGYIKASNENANVRKETATDILQEWADDNKSMGIDNTFVKNIAEKYGVEIEE